MEKLIIKYITLDYCFSKSVKSTNPCKSVIQTSYDIIKAHGGELKVETKNQGSTTFIIHLPN